MGKHQSETEKTDRKAEKRAIKEAKLSEKKDKKRSGKKGKKDTGEAADSILDEKETESTPSDISADTDALAADGAEEEEGFIQFKNVRKIYRMGEVEIEALAGVDFIIKKGEFVVIAGASGAGKSTILNILGGMDSLTSGTILVDGENIGRYNSNQLITYRRYDVGFVFQFYNLVQNLTTLENVELAAQVSQKPLDIREVIDDVGLTSRINNFPSQLSGGEQQRVAIARALAKNPKLLLCDEPTGALDYVTGKSILKLLQETCRRTGTTVIVISHNLALTALGDRVIKVKSGRVDSITINETVADVEEIEW